MPIKRVAASALRQAIATTKTMPTNRQGRSIKQNLNRTLAKVQRVPATVGTGILQS